MDTAYLAAVERAFLQRAGRGLMLSPADIALVTQWARAGVPVGVVLEGIDAAFAKPPSRAPRGLSFVRASVEAAFSAYRARQAGGGASGPAAPRAVAEPAARRLFVAAEAQVDALVAQALRDAARACDALGELADAAAVDAIERALLDRLRAHLSPSDAGAMLREIDARCAQERRGSSPEVWLSVREAQFERALRTRAGLPARLADIGGGGF
jgi:hypothetical protein